jgi:hypothetical protein
LSHSTQTGKVDLLKIENSEHAKSMVRKYIVGTRTRHGKIASITINEEAEGPDSKGTWTMEGTFVTEEGDKEQFTASVTSRGEVLMTSPAPPQATGNLHQNTRNNPRTFSGLRP